MRSLSTIRGVRAVLVAAGLAVSATALAFPWDFDMADSQSFKAYEIAMVPPPEGSVAQPNLLTPRDLPRPLATNDPAAQAKTNPYEVDDALLVTGEKMYATYCWPCHGTDATLGPVAGPGRWPMVGEGSAARSTIMPLVGPTSTVKVRTDGFIYHYVRNGGVNMPSYGWAMSDREIWSVVAYLRTVPGNKSILAP